MVENAKNLSLELNEDDKEILDKVVLNYAVKFYALTQQYPSPKKYAEEYLLKAVNKDSNIAAVFTITYAMTSPHGQQIRPGELNQKLANNIQNAFKEQYIDVASQLQNNEFVKKFLSPHDLRMDVLKKLDDQGIFIHLTTEEEIRRQQDRRSHSYGRSSSTTIYNERGGRLSVYILADDVERLKRAMEKTGSIEYLYREMIKSGLAEKLFKFHALAFLHAAKLDKRVLDMAIGAGASFFQESQGTVDTAKAFQQLQQIDDNKLEQTIDSQIKSIVEDRGYYSMLSLAGLLKL
jgi:hypothetical protein